MNVVSSAASAYHHQYPSLEELQKLTIASSLSYLESLKTDNARSGSSGEQRQSSASSKRRKLTLETSPYFDSTLELQPITQVVDEQTQSGATIFRTTKTTSSTADTTTTKNQQHIIVACRGSANVANFLTNLDFKLVPVDDSLLSCPDDVPSEGLVHRGFQLASLELWNLIEPELWNVITSVEEEQEDGQNRNQLHVTFTGHSLGAANALLCGVQYASTMKERQRQVVSNDDGSDSRSGNTSQPSYSIVTVGGPRLVNTVFADYLRTHVLSEARAVCNLIHSYDPILRQNQALWDSLGFKAVGQERICSMDQLKVYDTSTLQTDVLAWNFLDHCRYLGIFVGPRGF
eukprot:CAMPEP_0113511786 /NCGR_PEP_ID=MMETSP0014_2-20120614/38950_1 /TAXON_ID=2857 /ORGANISM="Nitzschia sp." /LENGTH=345 /DNA_ID=CAMNT_0000408017 /DNA_START=163 /DNA_END=1200 /DNA_ORIENTATION=- /assembly_acc=CAM_ASM_000159